MLRNGIPPTLAKHFAFIFSNARDSTTSLPEMAMGMGTGGNSHSYSHYSREYREWEWKFQPRHYSHRSREFWEWEWVFVGIPNSQKIPKIFLNVILTVSKPRKSWNKNQLGLKILPRLFYFNFFLISPERSHLIVNKFFLTSKPIFNLFFNFSGPVCRLMRISP